MAIEPEGRFRLTPLYDVISVWPLIGHGANRLALERARMAMAAISRNPHYRWNDIHPRHWLSTARACGFDTSVMQEVLDELIEQTPLVIASIESTLPAGFPASVSAPILGGLEYGVGRLVPGE